MSANAQRQGQKLFFHRFEQDKRHSMRTVIYSEKSGSVAKTKRHVVNISANISSICIK